MVGSNSLLGENYLVQANEICQIINDYLATDDLWAIFYELAKSDHKDASWVYSEYDRRLSTEWHKAMEVARVKRLKRVTRRLVFD